MPFYQNVQIIYFLYLCLPSFVFLLMSKVNIFLYLCLFVSMPFYQNVQIRHFLYLCLPSFVFLLMSKVDFFCIYVFLYLCLFTKMTFFVFMSSLFCLFANVQSRLFLYLCLFVSVSFYQNDIFCIYVFPLPLPLSQNGC